jgi:quinohemoprotein ethanol dehydrogenase
MVTADGLVMMGDADGFLNIYDGNTGEQLHRIEIGTGIMAAPMSYEVGGQHYVAVAAGFGGAFNSYFHPGTAAAERENNPRVVVFKLGGKAPVLPPRRVLPSLVSAPAEFRGTPAQVAHGLQLFGAHCAACHGDASTNSGYPNLWAISPETHRAFEKIVLGGAYADAGMASFADVLSRADARDLHAFIAEPLAAPAPASRKPSN